MVKSVNSLVWTILYNLPFVEVAHYEDQVGLSY